jgi:hypothetical protein
MANNKQHWGCQRSRCPLRANESSGPLPGGRQARQVFDLPEPTPLAATVRSKKSDFAVGLLRYYLLIK